MTSLDSVRLARLDAADRRAVAALDRDRWAVEHVDRAAVGIELDAHARPVSLHPERDALPRRRQAGREPQRRPRVVQPGEPEDDRAPHPTGRGDVDAVAGVAVGVGEVDEQRLAEVADGELVVADLRRRHRLDARRQRRVAGRDRVVVVEVAALLLERELVAAQHHRQHHVGLLEHLVAVDHERVVVQQQRVLVRRRVVEVPRLEVEEAVVLRMDAELLVVGQEHRLRRPCPPLRLVVLQPDPASKAVVGVGVPLPEQVDDTRRVAHVEPGHDVRVQVVVDHGRVLVGPVTPWMRNVSSPLAA